MPELLLSCQDIAKAYGAKPLFEGLSFGISTGEQIGMVGPNGSGKSTLLRILAGLEPPDAGAVVPRRDLVVAYVPQDPSFEEGSTVEEVVLAGLADAPGEEFEKATRAAVALSQACFTDPVEPVATLSGGWRKRLAIARALALAPELLLLDEPTNHLDIEGIDWLEGVLGSAPHAFVVVSHDRYFLESAARRMLELSRSWPKGLLEVRGGYRRFLMAKSAAMAGAASHEESLANRVRRELDWLSHKARARTRKAQARVEEASRLAAELDGLRERASRHTADLEFSSSGRRTRELVVVRDAAAGYGGAPVISGLSLVLSPHSRIGLVGPNGSGKSTVLKLLAGELAPVAGKVVHAPDLRVARFEQGRSGLDPAQTLRESLTAHGDAVLFQDRAVHVASWAKRFLFTADQLEQPVGRLSGGEQARVQLARLMVEPADVLLLDEPTNDLDIPTLEVLEESLLEFHGALVLVTHDRYLLDRISNSIVALDGVGGAERFADYAQWEAARTSKERPSTTREARGPGPALRRDGEKRPGRPRRLSYRERIEWEGMEEAILEAEAEVEATTSAANDPAIASDAAALLAAVERMEEARAHVARLYTRWAELEAKQQG